MNMQLRQCFTKTFARAKLFRLRKSQETRNFAWFFDFQKSQRCSQKVKLATLISNSASSFLLIHIQAFYIT